MTYIDDCVYVLVVALFYRWQ